MNVQLGDTGVSLGDISDAGKATSDFAKATTDLAKASKDLPGMPKSDDQGAAGPEVCSACNQKVVTTQPGSGTNVDDAVEKAGNAADCCGKFFDCFNKGLDSADKIQQMTGQE